MSDITAQNPNTQTILIRLQDCVYQVENTQQKMEIASIVNEGRVVAFYHEDKWYTLGDQAAVTIATDDEREIYESASMANSVHAADEASGSVFDALKKSDDELFGFLNELDTYGNTRFMTMANKGHPVSFLELVKKATTAGYDLNAVNSKGNTAYMFAAMGSEKNAVTLFEAGADITIRNMEGQAAHELPKLDAMRADVMRGMYNSVMAVLEATPKTTQRRAGKSI